MKNFKKLLIPVGLIVLVVGIFSFTTYEDGDDEKCTIKIVKIVNGVETVIDSIFDCDESMTWMSELHGMGDSLHKMIKIMMIDGDSMDCNFKFDFEFDENDETGMKMMKFKGEDGKEVEMEFDFKMLDGEDGVMKMMVNGKEMEIKIDDIHKHMKKMHENMDIIHDKSGNVEILIESDGDDGEAHSIKIIKTVDDDGNVTMKKIVDGEEVEIDENEMHKMHGHKMMFIGDDRTVTKMKGNHTMTIDVNVDSKDGKESKHIVIITKITNDDKVAKKISAGLDKKELSIDKLKFSPNPNDGKFDLSFKLDKKQPVQIKIFDVQGKEVYSEKVASFDGKYTNNIDISDSGEGIYILQIVQGNKASTSKVVIK